ncbi:hypothetical protein [Bacillus thuringiensis]|uniref:hypothetical protein n=1 Tax=Bacillus thuringiensis TaxID=1428 RepID=UPI000E2E6015|nr:hypothetical protein [Bacillus thuringiensis]RFB53686.1 hypothetical protein DZB90_24810 [Bacillus thuringiensis]
MDIFDMLENKLFNDEIIDKVTMNKLKFQSINEFQKEKKKRKVCIIPGCKNKSIKRSHSIQKSGSLKIISSDSHLLQPSFEMTADEPNMIMKKVGIQDASTFPGFCQNHEKLFAEFENKRDINSVDEAKLQAYRSICRELVHNQLELEWSNKNLVKYKSERNRQAKLMLEKYSKKALKKVNIECDDYRINYAQMAKSILNDKLTVLNNMHDSLYAEITNKKHKKDLYMEAIKIDFQFPIALCGIGYANLIQDENDRRNVISILNIVPFESSTILIFAGNINDKLILEEYLKFVSQNPFTILGCIESFMMHGTDHWFISPELWDKFDAKKKKFILNYFFATEKSFMHSLEFSIFDEIRRGFLEKFSVSEEIAKYERDKLNFKIPTDLKDLSAVTVKRYNDYYT